MDLYTKEHKTTIYKPHFPSIMIKHNLEGVLNDDFFYLGKILFVGVFLPTQFFSRIYRVANSDIHIYLALMITK